MRLLFASTERWFEGCEAEGTSSTGDLDLAPSSDEERENREGILRLECFLEAMASMLGGVKLRWGYWRKKMRAGTVSRRQQDLFHGRIWSGVESPFH